MGRERPIYLDNHATTRPDPRVLDAMWPWFTESFGNASSRAHAYGWEAAEGLDQARQRVAESIGASPREIVFTSGATESNNLAIKGIAASRKARGNHLVAASSEHKSVLDVIKGLTRAGWETTLVAPDRHGMVSVEAVAEALEDRTILVSVMAANNEVGTLNPVAEIGRLCQSRGIVFHTDATQAVGRVPVDVDAIEADLLSLSGHKMHGPKGIGALYVRSRSDRPLRLAPLLEGGGQERGLRSGTVAVPLAVGLGRACELAIAALPTESIRIARLRDRLFDAIASDLDGVVLNGHPTRRLPGNLNLSFEGVDGEALMMAMTEVAVSSGSACSSANPEPSHVLRAMGVDERLALASLRFGLGRFTTEDEVDRAAAAVVRAVRRLRDRKDERTRVNPREPGRLGFDGPL